MFCSLNILIDLHAKKNTVSKGLSHVSRCEGRVHSSPEIVPLCREVVGEDQVIKGSTVGTDFIVLGDEDGGKLGWDG